MITQAMKKIFQRKGAACSVLLNYIHTPEHTDSPCDCSMLIESGQKEIFAIAGEARVGQQSIPYVPVILTVRILYSYSRGYPLNRQAHFCQVPFADVVIITTLLSSLSLSLSLATIRVGLYHFSFIFTPVTVSHTYACDKQLKSAHQFDVPVCATRSCVT